MTWWLDWLSRTLLHCRIGFASFSLKWMKMIIRYHVSFTGSQFEWEFTINLRSVCWICVGIVAIFLALPASFFSKFGSKIWTNPRFVGTWYHTYVIEDDKSPEKLPVLGFKVHETLCMKRIKISKFTKRVFVHYVAFKKILLSSSNSTLGFTNFLGNFLALPAALFNKFWSKASVK